MSSEWFDLSGRAALVTGSGANGGIGHAIALGLAHSGADVFVADIDVEGAGQTSREIEALGRKSGSFRCDVSVPEQVEALFKAYDATFDKVDILVNNVGIGRRSHPEDLSLDDWHTVMAVNLDSTFMCAREAGRRMIRQGHGGSIINISSIAGITALGRGNFVYSVTKGGINQLTRELAVEWSPHQIRVNAIMPAQIVTPLLQQMFDDPRLDTQRLRDRLLAGIPLARLGEPDDIAKAAVFLASDAAGFITGHLLPVDGGNLALNGGGSRVWPQED